MNESLAKTYSHKEIEKKWQKYWNENNTFYTNLLDFTKPKKYILPMFPYPSGNGLHVGHVRNYTIADAMARFYRMLGFNVLFVTGWDAFGLPSEQYAIKTNNHPSIFTDKNIKRFKEQLINLGFSYDWKKEINTSHSTYYHWTQWIFKRIYLEGLAEYKNYPVFWCEKLSTVLSNEEIKNIDGKLLSERGLFPVEKKNISQWLLKITKYADQLNEDLNYLDWPLNIKNLQRNWIGISNGTIIRFKILKELNNLDIEDYIKVFTTRSDTIYGVNSIAISPSFDLLKKFVSKNFKFRKKIFDFCKKWENYNYKFFNKNEMELEGEFTGTYCYNPINNELIPIWVTNFAFPQYGTGSFMISSFYEDWMKLINDKEFFTEKEIKQNFQIDYSFSRKYSLRMKKIFSYDNNLKKIFYVNSELINGLSEKEKAIEKIDNWLEENNLGNKSSTLHLKDWVFSRQRYWGEPIPIIHFKDGKKELISDEKLPLKLPYLSEFIPSSDFYSPLQRLKKWVEIEDEKGRVFSNDINIMPQWAGSCWYYISFLLRETEKKELINKEFKYIPIYSENAKKMINYWLPVDLYIGGQEHANLHLLYARFWYKILHKLSLVSSKEPFSKLVCQGMILGNDGEKMSKSKGNIINPDDFIEKWGSDSLRIYEIFLGPVDKDVNFDPNGVFSMRRWLNRVYALFRSSKLTEDFFDKEKYLNYFKKIILDITSNYHGIKLNLVISNLMKFINICYSLDKVPVFYGKIFLQMLNPIAPHITEELWSIFEKKTIAFEKWPYFEKIDLKEKIKILIQVNSKLKDIIFVESFYDEKYIISLLEKNPKFSNIIKEKKIKKIIFIKEKVINLITN